MKIAFVSNLLEPTGGDDILLHHISGLRSQGHNITAFFSGIMPQSQEKYPEISKTITLYSPENIDEIDFSPYDLVVTNGLFGLNLLQDRKDINKAHFLQNFDPWIFGFNEMVGHAYRSLDKILLYSSHLQNIVEHYYGKKNIIKCNNGINYKEFSKARKTDFLRRRNSVCFMTAYYRPYKGIKLAEEVFQILKGKGIVTIEICSVNGPLQNTMEFYKNPSFNRKCEIINSSPIMLHPSIFETWNLVSMEAMSLGTLVVGTDSKGITEYANKDNSIIVNHRNPDTISDIILSVLNNRHQYLDIVEKGIETAQKHDWDTIMPEIEQCYRKLL